MEPQLKPVPIDESQIDVGVTDGSGTDRRDPNKRHCATRTGCSRCRCCRRSPARSSACRSISRAFYATSPIMAPLLMFGVMIGSLFVVSALRNSAWGVAALFGFTFIAGLMLTPILHVRRRLQERRPAGRAGRRHDGGGLLRHGDDRHGDQARLQLPRQVPVRRADPADRRVARQPVLPDPGAVGDDLGDRGADLLALPAARPEPASSAAARPTTSWRRSACSSTSTTSSSACSTCCWSSRASATEAQSAQ